MNEGIVEGGEDTSNTENELAYTSLVSATNSPSSKSHSFSKFRRGTKIVPSEARGARLTFSPALPVFCLGGAIFEVRDGRVCVDETRGERRKRKKEASISSINAHIEAESCDAVPVAGLGRGGYNDYVISPEKLE